MIVSSEENIKIITQEKATLVELVQMIQDRYTEFEHHNIIVNLFSLETITASDINEFLLLSKAHKSKKHSFVLVSSKVDIDACDASLVVVPTVQEAKDLIEMEEIERDLGF